MTNAGGDITYSIYPSAGGSVSLQHRPAANEKVEYITIGPVTVRLTNGANPVYTFENYQGSTVAAVNANGAVAWRESYTPFGEALTKPAANDNRRGFTGHVGDAASNLVYMQARYFDPAVGRFLSTDPVGYQDQLNLYAYVHNDPVGNVDPDGTSCERVGGSRRAPRMSCRFDQINGNFSRVQISRMERAYTNAVNRLYASSNMPVRVTIAENKATGLFRAHDVADALSHTTAIAQTGDNRMQSGVAAISRGGDVAGALLQSDRTGPSTTTFYGRAPNSHSNAPYFDRPERALMIAWAHEGMHHTVGDATVTAFQRAIRVDPREGPVGRRSVSVDHQSQFDEAAVRMMGL